MKILKKKFQKEDKLKIKSPNVNLNEKQKIFDHKDNTVEESFSGHKNILDFLLSLISEQVSLQESEKNENFYQIMCHFESE